MHFHDNEQIIRVFRHHPLFFILRFLALVLVSFPFYFLAYLFMGNFSRMTNGYVFGGITVIFVLFFLYDLMVYFFDALIVTNLRIVYRDWSSAFRNSEVEAMLKDIQDIKTKENGFFAHLPVFDFGVLEVATSSNRTIIEFREANDPEGIKKFIYNTIDEVDLVK